MARGRDTRLGRLAASAALADSAEGLDRCALRARAAVCALVGEALAEAGIDPARAPAMRLAPHPASGVRDQFDEFAASDDDGLAGIFAAKIGDIARRYEDERKPDFGNASLAELFAWSLTLRRRSSAASQPLRPAGDRTLNRDAPPAAQKNRS
jgi:hypothetical protein